MTTEVTFAFDETQVSVDCVGADVEMTIDVAPTFEVVAAMGMTTTIFTGGAGRSLDAGNDLTIGSDGGIFYEEEHLLFETLDPLP